jgi:hypothetical protein
MTAIARISVVPEAAGVGAFPPLQLFGVVQRMSFWAGFGLHA